MARLDYLDSTMFTPSPVAPSPVTTSLVTTSPVRQPVAVRAVPAACFDMVKNILIATGVLAALLAGRALAADLPPPPVPLPPVPKVVAPIANWSGPYLGFGIGTRFNAV